MHNAAKYREISEALRAANAEYDDPAYELLICSQTRTDTHLKVLARIRDWRGTPSEGVILSPHGPAFETFKKLAGQAWSHLPTSFDDLHFQANHQDATATTAWQRWTLSLYVDLVFTRELYREKELALRVFEYSDKLISKWQLDTDSPRPPEWLTDTISIGELLRRLGEIEGDEMEAARFNELAGRGAVVKGSHEANAFLQAERHRSYAEQRRKRLYADSLVDALTAQCAAETSQSGLTREYVQKLTGELAQREGIGCDEVKERPVGELLRTDNATGGADVVTAEGSHGTTPYPNPSTYERDKWIYENIVKLAFEDLKLKMKNEAKTTRWQLIGSRPGIKKAADRYAGYHGLPRRRYGTK